MSAGTRVTVSMTRGTRILTHAPAGENGNDAPASSDMSAALLLHSRSGDGRPPLLQVRKKSERVMTGRVMTGATPPNWSEINRVISESIEPRPTTHPRGLGRSYVAWTFSNELKPQDDKWVMVGWQPRNWREPSAAMELLKRMLKDDGDSVVFTRTQLGYFLTDVFDDGYQASTLEETIVLAYRNLLKQGESEA